MSSSIPAAGTMSAGAFRSRTARDGFEPQPRQLRMLPRLLLRVLGITWRAEPRRIIALTVISVVYALGVAFLALGSRSIIGQLLDHHARDSLAPSTVISFVALGLGALALRALNGWIQRTSQLLGMRVDMRAEEGVLRSAARLPLVDFDVPALHEGIYRAVLGTTTTTRAAVLGSLTVLSTALSILALAAVLVSIQVYLLPLLAIAAIVDTLATTLNADDQFLVFNAQAAAGLMRNSLRASLVDRDRAKEVHAFALADALLCRWRGAYEATIQATEASMARGVRRSFRASIVSTLLAASGIAFVVLRYEQGLLPLASAVTAILAFLQTQSWLRQLGNAFSSLYTATVFLTNNDALERRAAHHSADAELAAAVPPKRAIALRDVSFAYPGSPGAALKSISVEIPVGAVVAIVGENGSGKTTLAKLLAHLYAPSQGHVYWDGRDLSQCKPDSVRDHIAVMFQDHNRYELTAQENVGFGRTEKLHDVAGIRAAARAAGIDTVLAGLAHGYETMLSPRMSDGADLSLGQWQRVALARALFRDAPILIFDEPTSMLDAKAEARLFGRLRRLAAGRTAILVSHRLTSISTVDTILVLHAGRLCESGTHAQLLASNGRYARLYRVQTSALRGEALGHELA